MFDHNFSPSKEKHVGDTADVLADDVPTLDYNPALNPQLEKV